MPHARQQTSVDVFDCAVELFSQLCVGFGQRDHLVLAVSDDLIHAMRAEWSFVVDTV